MSLGIKIANMTLFLRNGEDLINSLNPAEKRSLTPFLTRTSSRNRTGHPVIVNVRRLRHSGLNRMCVVDAESLKLIRSYFYQFNIVLEKVFNQDIEEMFGAYLCENPLNHGRLLALLKDGRARNKIIIRDSAFAIYDRHKECYNLVYKKKRCRPDQPSHNIKHIKMLLRMVLNTKKDGAIIHASSIAHHGNGYMFVGFGGAGKSTVVKMLEPEKILSDDTAVIRRAGGVYNIYANPWWNGCSKTAMAEPFLPVPLKAIFFIGKAKKTAVRRLHYKEALSSLIFGDVIFQQSFLFDNREGIRSFYLFAQGMLGAIPVFKLDIKKGPDFKRFFYNFIEKSFDP